MIKIKSINKFIFILVFLILILVVHIFLNYEQSSRINNILNTKTKQINLEYQVLYDSYHTLSKMIFQTQINTKDIIDLFANRKRNDLQKHLSKKYKELRTFNLRQLHFHLPNNDSFLRMHRPSKYGDNLSKDRLTVKYVNEYKKPIDGFEEGKIFNGFRFVYPMFDKEKYIGSVEVSFSALFFIQDIIKGYRVQSNFYIDKNVVEHKVFDEEKSNYKQSQFKNYYNQKKILEYLNHENSYVSIEKKLIKKIDENLNFGKTFSIYSEEKSSIITFIPLINPITKNSVAWLSAISYDESIKRMKFTKKIVFVIIVILIALILFFIYKQFIFQFFLEKEVDKKTKELNEFNFRLKDMIKEEVEKNKEQEEIMIAQSRHAAMGEMISMIAHQWRQPISVISMDASNILVDIELESIKIESLKNDLNDIINQTQELSKIIDDFRNFFKPKKTIETIFVKDIIDESLSVIGKSLENNGIILVLNIDEIIKITTYSRELMQVLINIIKNAKETFYNKDIEIKKIYISTKLQENSVLITVCDNGGGIEKKIFNKIFDPYFTTKGEKNGTGLGLYMSRIITQKHLLGKLEAYNKNDGACFKIELPFFIE